MEANTKHCTTVQNALCSRKYQRVIGDLTKWIMKASLNDRFLMNSEEAYGFLKDIYATIDGLRESSDTIHSRKQLVILFQNIGKLSIDFYGQSAFSQRDKQHDTGAV